MWNVPDDAPSPETHARASSSPVGQDGDPSDGKDDPDPARGTKFVPFFVRAGNAKPDADADADADAPRAHDGASAAVPPPGVDDSSPTTPRTCS